MGTVVVVILAVAQVWEGGGYNGVAGTTAIGASCLLFARLIARREASEHIMFFRERRLRGRTGRSNIFKAVRTGDRRT
jgi:hypothetical protein